MTTNKKKKHGNKIKPQQQQQQQSPGRAGTAKPPPPPSSQQSQQSQSAAQQTPQAQPSQAQPSQAQSQALPQLDPQSRSVLQQATECKQQGNAAFSGRQNQLEEAVEWYTRGLDLLSTLDSDSSTCTTHSVSGCNNNHPDVQLVRLQLGSNRAQVRLKLKQYDAVVEDCSAVLQGIMGSDEDQQQQKQQQQHHETNNDKNNKYTAALAKVWYRRALAREALAKQLQQQQQQRQPPDSQNNCEQQEAVVRLLQDAARDLQQCLPLVTNTDATMERTVLQAALRVRRSLEEQLQQQQQEPLPLQTPKGRILADQVDHEKNKYHNENNKTNNRTNKTTASTTATAATTTTATHVLACLEPTVVPPPAAEEQRQIVTDLLLLGRRRRRTQQAVWPGEAFFLLDWDWWCDWCAHTNFFTANASSAKEEEEEDGNGDRSSYQNDNNSNSNYNSERAMALLQCLPPGAVLPPVEEDDDDDDDDDDEATDAKDDNNNSNVEATAVADNNNSNETADKDENASSSSSSSSSPGYIDNAALLLPPLDAAAQRKRSKHGEMTTQSVYWHHWYQEYHQHPTTNNNNNHTSGGPSTPFLALQPGLVRGHHYELLPREVYHALRQWYGELTPPIVRRAQPVGRGELKIVLYPLYPRENSGATITSSTLPYSSLSSSTTTATSSTTTPCGLCAAPTGKLRCSRCQAVYYCDKSCQARHWRIRHKTECKEKIGSNNGDGNNNNNSSDLDFIGSSSNSDITTTRRNRRRRLGLNNIGNSCFLNSALQCLSHATPLTRTFLSGQFSRDLNPQNPLGSGGKLAEAYEQVVTDLHHGRATSFSPTALKRAVAVVAPRFAGCLQHDAQEFLAYLLDGLHEDLNRVQGAPYVEMPDFDASDCHAVAGATAWEAHRRRNDSLVLDTFYGQFKSQCVCPHCDRVSVSFDAFNHVSLEIPTSEENRTVSLPIVVLELVQGSAGGSRECLPVRYAVSVRRTARVSDVKVALLAQMLRGRQQEKEALAAAGAAFLDQLSLGEINHDSAALDCLHPDERPVMELSHDDLIGYYHGPPPPPASQAQQGHALRVVVTNTLRNTTSTTPTAGVENHFGIPLYLSLSNIQTCRDLWNAIWEMVRHNVVEEGGDEDAAKRLLQIRLVTREGDPIPFGVKEEEEEDDAATATTAGEEKKESAKQRSSSDSIIQPDSDQLLVQVMGRHMLEYMFVHLEWTAPSVPNEGNMNESITPLAVDTERFLRFIDHPSWIEEDKKFRAKAAGGKKSGVTLDQCFRAFTKPERLDEHNEWYCSTCKAHVRAMKTMQLWKLPNVFIVALKRFEFKHALRRDKLDTMVEFPLDGLDMGKYCASRGLSDLVDDQVPAIYDCFGVVNHYGRMGFGHYTAFARDWDETGISNDWTLFDDSTVHPVVHPQTTVVTNAAYVMFYRRRTFH